MSLVDNRFTKLRFGIKQEVWDTQCESNYLTINISHRKYIEDCVQEEC